MNKMDNLRTKRRNLLRVQTTRNMNSGPDLTLDYLEVQKMKRRAIHLTWTGLL